MPAFPMALLSLPDWALVLAVLVTTLGGTLVFILRAIMPQHSRDRLHWWRDRRRLR